MPSFHSIEEQEVFEPAAEAYEKYLEVLEECRRNSKNKCYYCGQEEKCTADHFYPKSKGGRLKVYACKLCQRTKGDMTPEQFVTYINNHIAIDPGSRTRITYSIRSLISLINRGELELYNDK
jgi:hypothetical protein